MQQPQQQSRQGAAPAGAGPAGPAGNPNAATPAWLAEGIAPSLTELREARRAERKGDIARKRLRAPVAIDPDTRRLHQLIASQLHHEGYTEAATSVLRATGTLAPAITEGTDGQRLARLVRLGELGERLRAPHPTEGVGAAGTSTAAVATGGVEGVLYGGSVYAAPAPAERYRFGEVYSSLPLDRPLRCVAFSPHAEYIACGATNGCLRLFSADAIGSRISQAQGVAKADQSLHGLVRVLPGTHEQSVEWIGFHPTAPVLISAGRDGRLCLTDYTEPQGRPALEHMPSTAPAAAAAAAQQSAASGAGGTGTATGGAAVADANAAYKDTFPIRAVAVHPSGEYVALATDHHTLRLLNLTTGAVLHPAEAHAGAIADVSFSADGRVLATASYDGFWRVIDGRTGSTTHVPPTAAFATAGATTPTAHCGVGVTSCQLSMSGMLLLTTGADNQTKLWDLRKSGTEVSAYGEATKVSQRLRSRFTFDEAAIVIDASTRKSTRVVDVFSGVEVAALEHAQVQRGLACSPTSQTVATCGDDYRLRLWTPSTLTLLHADDRRAGRNAALGLALPT